MSPVGQQLVNLPTWLWLAPGGWSGRLANAAVPGESVKATAKATAKARSMSWSMGDGGSVTCTGPGTPYTDGVNPDSSSPDCGYIYRRSSAGEPGSAFTVTATVPWSGGGQRGTFGDLTTTASVPVAVAESQSLTTD